MDAAGGGLVSGGLSGKVIGAFFDTYNELGHGFLEIDVRFHGRIVGEFRADMLVNDHLLIEIKAALRIAPPHEAQLLNYLKATGIRLGLLLNFGPSPEFRRRVFS
jgi:hypothetical protein